MKTTRILPIVLTMSVILGTVGCQVSYSESFVDEFEITTKSEETITTTTREEPVETTESNVTIPSSDISSSVEETTTVEQSTQPPTVNPTQVPTATSAPKPTITQAPKATSTPKPTATATVTPKPKPTVTATPKPTLKPTPEPTPTPIPTLVPTKEPKPTPTSVPTPTSGDHLDPVDDPRFKHCIVDAGWRDTQTGTSGTVKGVTARRNSAGDWILTDEAEDAVADAAMTAGAGGWASWIIEGSYRDFS